MFPILCSHASRAAPLRRCCLPCGMAFPRRNNKKCPSPPFQETETLKLLPSDSCSPCAKHFLTATNLGLSSIFYRTAPEKSIFFCRTSQFFCRRLRCCICLQQGEFRAPERGSLLAAVTCRLFSSMPPAAPFLPAAEEMGEKNAAKNQWFLESLSSDCSCGAKRFRNESPLRLPSLPLTWHAESNGRPPVWAIIKSRTCRQRRQVWVRPAGRGNYKILDIRIGAGFYPALSALRLRRPHFFQQRKKWGKERRQKPMVFGIPFVRLQLRCKKVPQRIASASTLAAADMARREQWSPSRLGDYQIAHLPPAAASVGAAR